MAVTLNNTDVDHWTSPIYLVMLVRVLYGWLWHQSLPERHVRGNQCLTSYTRPRDTVILINALEDGSEPERSISTDTKSQGI